MGRIFVSYHGHDEGGTIALHLREALRTAGYADVHAYTAPGSGPTVSLPWKDSLRRELLGAEALVVVTSPGSASEWCVWEVSVFRERKPHAPCVEFFSGPQGRVLLNDLQAQRVDASDPTSLAAAADTLLSTLSRAGVGTTAGISSPFPGLRAFDEHQASLFFGREDDVRRLADPLLGRRAFGAMAVIGPSGAGKSSLVRAGLIPLLRREGWTVIGPFTPSQDELPAFDRHGRTLVVLDQAEELLTGATDRLTPRSAELVRRLVAASRGEAWVVHTVRADFLDELMRHEEFDPLLRDDFLVTPLTKTHVPMIVNGPLRALGWSIDDDALGLIQEDTSRDSLPLLAFALENLWRHVNPDGLAAPRPITRAEYQASGRVMDVLRRQADEAFAMARDLVRADDGSWPPVREAEQRVLRVLRRLVSVDETGKFTRTAAALSPADRQLLGPFITNRVLTATREAVEVAHESLFVHWPRLTEALERDRAALRARQEVEDVATWWAKHPDQLIAPSRLPSLLTALGDADLSADGRRLLDLSLQQRLDEELRRVDRLSPSDTLPALLKDLATTLRAPDLSRWRRSLLNAMTKSPVLRTCAGHTAAVLGVDWSPDDAFLVSGSADGTVRIWDAGTAECRRVLPHGGVVRAVAWSLRGHVVASVGADATLRFWSPDTGEHRVVPLPAEPWSVRFDGAGDTVVVACDDGAHLWRVDDGEALGTFRALDAEGRPLRMWDADLSRDGTTVVVSADDGRVMTCTLEDLPCTQPWEGHTGPAAHSVRLNPGHEDGQLVLASSGDHRGVRVWSPRASGTLKGHHDAVRRIAWAPSGRRLASASADATVRVWDMVTGFQQHGHSVRHTRGVRDVAWSHHGGRIAGGGDDGLLLVHTAGAETTLSLDLEDPITALAWQPRGRWLTIATERGWSTWSARTEEGDESPQGMLPDCSSLGWSPDGRRLAIGSRLGSVTVLDENYRQIKELTTGELPVHDARWSPDGQVLAVAVGSSTAAIKLYDRDLNRLDAPHWTTSAGEVRCVAWHPHRQVFAACGNGLTLINSPSGPVGQHPTGSQVSSAAWHPGGDVLAVGLVTGTVLVLHVTDPLTAPVELRGQQHPVTAVAWSPDGRSLLSTSADRTGHVWDPATGALRTTLLGHRKPVTAGLWVSDDEVVTGSEDGMVRVWDVSDGFRHPMSGTPDSTGLDDLITETRRRIRRR
ncbi:hypothetical protein [Nocardia sp. NRRL S-836]|uniref:nSTAND1 domain-containing NTPase n=1 Tax=Nocardia sp. NRRL S-836 TaxID=1519492 RepID=UPI0006AE7BAF|nr:hypothetical protein [Nocardia sp. NRRL S-836]KOV81042.1 hypothetical protein ADL03_29830 [Nocardia sp. NRRL S-836]